jgi:hypothetical protein
MTIFAIINQTVPRTPKLAEAIAQKFGDKIYKIDGDMGWLVAANQTAQQISDGIGITDGSNGAAIVFEVGSYFGRANPNIWTWIKLNWEAS